MRATCRAALFFGIPISAVALLVIVWLAGGVEGAFIDLLVPAVAVAVAVLVLFAGAWRVFSLVHAAWLPFGRAWFRRRPVSGAVVALSLIVVVSHVWAVSVAIVALRRVRPDLRPPGGRSAGPVGAGTERRLPRHTAGHAADP